jgi:hypothetical protein
MIAPLNNNCLVEIIDDNDGLYSGTADENVQKGVLRDFYLIDDHITASAGYQICHTAKYKDKLADLIGKVVYWQEYADAGSKFEIDGKQYALVPFYRLIGFEE